MLKDLQEREHPRRGEVPDDLWFNARQDLGSPVHHPVSGDVPVAPQHVIAEPVLEH